MYPMTLSNYPGPFSTLCFGLGDFGFQLFRLQDMLSVLHGLQGFKFWDVTAACLTVCSVGAKRLNPARAE